jgi:hypothetical protein
MDRRAARVKKIKRTLKISLVLAGFTVLFIFLFRERFLKYTCESEGNMPSCSVLGMNKESDGDLGTAAYYYKKSCDGGYEIGCKKLDNLNYK